MDYKLSVATVMPATIVLYLPLFPIQWNKAMVIDAQLGITVWLGLLTLNPVRLEPTLQLRVMRLCLPAFPVQSISIVEPLDYHRLLVVALRDTIVPAVPLQRRHPIWG